MEITHSASVNAFALGLGTKEMLEIVQTIQRGHFIKSMTAKADHTLWQDVYNVLSQVGLLYIKFTLGIIHQFKLLSFKESLHD